MGSKFATLIPTVNSLRVRFLALVLAFFGVVLSVAVPLVQAQFTESDTINEATAAPQELELFPKVSEEERQAASEAYFSDVAAYRDAEERFLVAREQYYQLNTLASQEEAIRRGKEVLTARAQVIQSYFIYLRLTLLNTTGIDLDDKATTEQELQFWANELKEFQKTIPELTTRAQIDQELLKFNEQEDAYQNIGYAALILIKLGNVQKALDTAYVVRDELVEAGLNANLSAVKKADQERGVEETDRLLQQAKNNLLGLRQEWQERAGKNRYKESDYRNFQQDSEFSYLQLRQAYEFMQELAGEL